MKMQMIKYLFPIILALTAPAAAASGPANDECQTPSIVKSIAAEYGGVVYSDIKSGSKEYLVFKFDDGAFDVVEFTEGCTTNIYQDQTEDQVNRGLAARGIQKAQ